MFGGRSLSRVATKANIRSIPSVRYISSARSLSSIASRPVLPSDRLRLKASSYLPPASASSLSFARFNSTAAGSETPQATTDAASELDDLVPAIEDIPERLGYLKVLGLDYGWGPSSFMEWTIEHIHLLSGLPWWASIVTAAVLVRLALFKPAIMAADNAARTAPLRDRMLELRKQRLDYMNQGKQLEAAKAKVEVDELYKKNNISLWKSFLPMLQIPLGFGTFRVVRGMSLLPVPALATEEFAWIHDLTSYDPLYITPLLTSGVMYLAMRKGSSGSTDFQATSIGRSMMIGLPILSLVFMVWQPASLQLYFAASGVFALLQAHLLNTPVTRAWLGVAPPFKPTANQDAETLLGLRLIRGKNQEQAKQQQSSTEVSASRTKPENLSFIDKAVNGTKQEMSNWRKEMEEKVTEFTGNNAANGPKPRLTEEEKKAAKTYRAVREIEDSRRLERQSQSRISAYQKKVAKNPVSAKSWQDLRERAKKEAEAEAAAKKTSSSASSKSKTKPKAR